MSLLLDTHTWIWWLTGQEELSRKERQKIDSLAEKTPPVISDISLWEAQMIYAKGRLQLTIPFSQWLIQATLPDVVQLARLSPDVILKLDNLPSGFHGDPADRIIVATALSLGIPLFTYDRMIRSSRVVDIWKV